MPASIDDRDMGMDALLDDIKSMGGHVDIGVQSDEDEDVLKKATSNEFGTNNIPSRPFIRGAIDHGEDKFLSHAKGLSGAIIDGEVNELEALTEMGQLIEGDTKTYMINLREPPNSPLTIKLKGSDNPLIDTGELVGSIRYQVATNG